MENAIKNYDLHENVRSFVPRTHKHFIGGEWVESASAQPFDVKDPATGRVIARCASGTKHEVDLAVAAARKAFDEGPWSKLTPSERSKAVWKIGDLIDAHNTELSQLEALDNGKPVGVAAVADVPLAGDIFRYMAGWATKVEGETIPISVPYAPGAQFHSYTLRDPIGVVAQIIPWNFPLLMASWKLAPALAAGCTMVLKPAEQTPLSVLRLAELIQEADLLPPGVLNIVTGDAAAGAPLAEHPHVDKVAFTGSGEVGRLIAKAATGNFKKVSLELGGKSPTIVFPDANLEQAIGGVASAIFFNQGQVCCAGSRLYAHQSVFDEVVEGVSKIAKNIKVGPGLAAGTELGPLVSQEQFERVTGYVEDGRNNGAHVAAGGSDNGSDGGYFVDATVLTKVNSEMKVVREEIFGPVLCATPFTDDDLDAIARDANDTNYGLAAGVWTQDLSIAHKMAKKIQAGTVWVNCHNIFDASLPFGGYKESGWGREMGHEVLKNYTELKSVCMAL